MRDSYLGLNYFVLCSFNKLFLLIKIWPFFARLFLSQKTPTNQKLKFWLPKIFFLIFTWLLSKNCKQKNPNFLGLPEDHRNNGPDRIPSDVFWCEFVAGNEVCCWSPAQVTRLASVVIDYAVLWARDATPATCILSE